MNITLPRWLPGLILLLLAIATGWMVWQLQRADRPEPQVGPPRSDYQLLDFELVALDEHGKESFRINGPMLSRHPYLATLEVSQPRFLFPDSSGQPWNARAERAWVARDGSELRLNEQVEFDGPPDASGERIELRTEQLTVLPDSRQLRNQAAVTVTGPGSILRGRNLDADLEARRFRLSEMTGHYAPPTR